MKKQSSENHLSIAGLEATKRQLCKELSKRRASGTEDCSALCGEASTTFENTALLLRSIADNSPDAIFAKNHEGRYLLFNPAAAKMIGMTVDEVIGRNDIEVFGPEGAEVVLNTDRMVRESKRKLTIEEHIPIRGEVRVFLTSMFPYLDDNGELIGTMGIARDVTEFKELESQLLRAQKMESLGILAGGIAHNFNNILAPILMSIDMLKQGTKNEEDLSLLDSIEHCANRGADLVRQVKIITDNDSGPMMELDIIPVLKEVTQIAGTTFREDISVKLELPDNLWPVMGDASQIHQILLNFGINGREAMPNGGTLTFTASNFSVDKSFAKKHLDASPGDYVRLEVIDTGTGMSPEMIDRIFEPFYTTKDLSKGAGLDLSISQSIVNNHRGFILVQSEVGNGTRIQIYLPKLEFPD
ncbi:MAG: PAS domain-containing protein [Verrucomicrobiales bacterium]|nr:PAS domain-containing protein [Verrucomicrobiales bacterium]